VHDACRRDPNNLLTMLDTWTHGDIGATPGFDGSLEKALASIKVSLSWQPCCACMLCKGPVMHTNDLDQRWKSGL
jgi:hypothetical protein